MINLVNLSDIDEESTEIPKQHRTLEERAKSFGGKLGPYEEFDWGRPVGADGESDHGVVGESKG